MSIRGYSYSSHTAIIQLVSLFHPTPAFVIYIDDLNEKDGIVYLPVYMTPLLYKIRLPFSIRTAFLLPCTNLAQWYEYRQTSFLYLVIEHMFASNHSFSTQIKSLNPHKQRDSFISQYVLVCKNCTQKTKHVANSSLCLLVDPFHRIPGTISAHNEG